MGKGLIAINEKIPVLAVCGATASGKTALAVQLAKHFNGEVVSSDSMQIYRGMDIGTAKPTVEEMQGVPHHMIDVADIDCNFSVSDYCEAAHSIISDIHSRHKLPVLAGGTGLYVDSLLNDIDFNRGVYDEVAREKYVKLSETVSEAELHKMLEELDPEAAAQIHMNNVKRVIRALEHIESTGEKFSDYKKRAAEKESRYNAFMLFIDRDREELYQRIDMRVDIMVKDGLIDEARRIYDRGYSRELTSMGAIGYKELFDSFDGKCTVDEAVELIKQSSRRYAKRQLTWFRRNENLCHIQAGDGMFEAAVTEVKKWLEAIDGKIQL